MTFDDKGGKVDFPWQAWLAVWASLCQRNPDFLWLRQR
jgi:hypothetical protein